MILIGNFFGKLLFFNHILFIIFTFLQIDIPLFTKIHLVYIFMSAIPIFYEIGVQLLGIFYEIICFYWLYFLYGHIKEIIGFYKLVKSPSS